MAKFDKEAMKKTRIQVATLKSTGQSKFALDEDKGDVSLSHLVDNKEVNQKACIHMRRLWNIVKIRVIERI